MSKSINLKGTSGKTYNLDEIVNTNTRHSSEEELLVHVWKWNPNLPNENPHSKPNPPQPVIGQMWLTKLVETDSPEYKELVAEYFRG